MLPRATRVGVPFNHGLEDEPRLFYMHGWAHEDAQTLTGGLRAAFDLTNSAKGWVRRGRSRG